MSEMTWYDRDVERARRTYEAALKFREDLLERDAHAEGTASEEAEKARKEKALADLLNGLSLTYGISHPDPGGGEEETVETVKATFDFELDRYENSAIFQSVSGPPECGYLIQLPTKLSFVTVLFRGLGDCDLEPFGIEGIVRCSGANHRGLAHEGVLKFAGYKQGDEAE